MRTCLTLAVAFISGGVVSFVLSEYGRVADDRRNDAEERRRLVAELRHVHHCVKTAQLRIRAHKTALTYGIEIRDVMIPAIAQLGGVISDVKHQRRNPDPIVKSLSAGNGYLRQLTDEYQREYLRVSLIQEAAHKWRQHRLAELIKQPQFASAPPTTDQLPAAFSPENPAWRYLTGRDDKNWYRLPRLAAFLELPDPNGTLADSHQAGFSDPIRSAMNHIEEGRGV
jgi:hypothetical protein